MTATTFIGHFLGPDVHASRPAAAGLPDGTLYVCTTHSKIERVVSGAWVDYATLGSAGGVSADTLWDAKGDLAVATGADAASKLPVGSNGQVLTADSTQTTGIKWAAAGGGGGGVTEVGYTESTSSTTVGASDEGSANTVVAASAFTADGTSAYLIEFYAPSLQAPPAGNAGIYLWLYQDGSSIGRLALTSCPGGGSSLAWPAYVARRLVPASGSHTYSIRASVSGGTGYVIAGAGGSGNQMPAFIRITKVT